MPLYRAAPLLSRTRSCNYCVHSRVHRNGQEALDGDTWTSCMATTRCAYICKESIFLRRTPALCARQRSSHFASPCTSRGSVVDHGTDPYGKGMVIRLDGLNAEPGHSGHCRSLLRLVAPEVLAFLSTDLTRSVGPSKNIRPGSHIKPLG